MTRKLALRFSIVALCLANVLGATLVEAQDQPQQGQDKSQQDQSQSDQQQQKKKKKGGFFKGLRSVTGESGEQTEATRTAGSKSVGEGQKIAEVTPSGSDWQALDAMEKYSVPSQDLKKFQADGHLQPKP